MSGLMLEIVTPLGVQIAEEGLDRIILRRREPVHDEGSLISVYPSHGPLLVQTSAFVLRWDRAGEEGAVPVGPGVAEIYRDHVTLLATRAG
ncbi:MAG: hypothetical protein OEV43_02850 [Coriobacteriia bacterium]|nr:hypothetical protein [Coriobacteriia bacterium]